MPRRAVIKYGGAYRRADGTVPRTEPLSIDIQNGVLEAAKSRQYHDNRAVKFGLWQ